ncbi:MAG TPA: PAS domain S-box protein [Pseudomonadales bacterium]|nr:PAS domain S-box protein [Pseudomonadales bacterium]
MNESTQLATLLTLLIVLALLAAAWLVQRDRLAPRRVGGKRPLPKLPRAFDLTELLQTLPVSVTVTDHLAPDEPLIYGNDHFFDSVGYAADELLGQNLRILQGPDTNAAHVAELGASLSRERGSATRLVNYRADGSPFWNLVTIQPVRDAHGKVTHNIGIQLEIDDLMRKEQELLLRQRQHFAIAATTQAALEATDLEELLTRGGELIARALRADRLEIVEACGDERSPPVRSFGPRSDPTPGTAADPDCLALHMLRAGGTLVSGDLTEDHRFKKGPSGDDPELHSAIGTQIVDEMMPWGAICAFGTQTDQFERTDADLLQSMAYLLGSAITRLRQNRSVEEHARFVETVLDNFSEAIVTIDAEGIIRAVNGVLCELWGHAREEVIGNKVEMLMNAGDARRHDGYMQQYMNSGSAKIIGRGREVEALHADGTLFPVWLTITETSLDGRKLFVGTLRDLRAQKSTQAQLLQSQKMESVGQLTGGVAHDFNNLLTVILGNLSMALETAPDTDHRDLLVASRDAAQRGADLTRSLLAFARRQPLRPALIDLDRLFANLQSMAQRLLDERYRVTVEIAPDTGAPFVDEAQLESALLNLAINARDAMPDGGAIRVAATTAPGQDAMMEITVSDTGPGVPEALRDHVFEPFFTTKEAGKGTGLGLAMIHGFAYQSGGDVSVGTAEGGGACFRMRLPCNAPDDAWQTDEADAVLAPAPGAPLAQADATALRVLLVEDDIMVARIADKMLRRLGHDVTIVDGPEAAMDELHGTNVFDVLFTDTVLDSAISGRDLARTAAGLRPELALLITSGYTEDPTTPVVEGAVFLQKPYSMGELTKGLAAARTGRHGHGAVIPPQTVDRV